MLVSSFSLFLLGISVLPASGMTEIPMEPGASIKDLKMQFGHDDSESALSESETPLSEVSDLPSGEANVLTTTSVRDASSRDEVLSLNRWTFQGNIHGGDVDNWIVVFCLSWYEPCQEALPVYQRLASEWQEKMDDGEMLRTNVRFAHVDCTTQRVLCNEQDAHDYPRIVHYRNSDGSPIKKPLVFRKVRTIVDAEKQMRSFLALRLLARPPVVQLDLDLEEEETIFFKLARLSGLKTLLHDDMVDVCLLLTACAAAAGLYVTRGAGEKASSCSADRAPTEMMKAHVCTADLLPQEWASQRQEIAL